MSEFFFTLRELASYTNSTLVGDPEYCIKAVADLESASPQDASFLANPRYVQAMRSSKAGVVFVDATTLLIENRNFLINENPSQAFQKTVEAFHKDSQELSDFLGIHASAVIHASCKIKEDVSIGPQAVLDKNVSVGERTFIGAGCYIGPGTVIGKDCIIHPRVAIREFCIIGDRVIIQPGAVIGSCGFGYITDKFGRHTKLNQLGNVVIEDDVEIGANSTIDRARFKTTRIGRGTKIDNLVQIAHGVIIGEHNLIVAQTGIAGSTQTGKHVIIGGQVAIAGHLKIADGVMIAGKAGVTKSVTKAGKYGGVAGILPLEEFNRNGVFLRNIEKYVNEIKNLQARLEILEKK